MDDYFDSFALKLYKNEKKIINEEEKQKKEKKDVLKINSSDVTSDLYKYFTFSRLYLNENFNDKVKELKLMKGDYNE